MLSIYTKFQKLVLIQMLSWSEHPWLNSYETFDFSLSIISVTKNKIYFNFQVPVYTSNGIHPY